MDKLAHMADWEIRKAIEENQQLRADLRDAAIFINSMNETLLPAASLWYKDSHNMRIWTRNAKEILNRPSVKAAMEGKDSTS